MSVLLQNLLAARKRLGLTQQKMAEKLGITRNYLALIETGKRPVPASVAEYLASDNQQDVDTLRETPAPYVCSRDASSRIAELEAELALARETIHNLSVALARATPNKRSLT